jgi:cytochrome c biogenesis factor
LICVVFRNITLGIFILVIYYIFIILNGNTFGVSVVHDHVNRFNPNDSFISSYYLLWTVLYYIPFFIIILISKLIYLNSTFSYKNIINHVANLLVLSFYYLTELLDFFATNYSLHLITDSDTNFNTLLTNSLNRYHPYLFYFCASYFLYENSQTLIKRTNFTYNKSRTLNIMELGRERYALLCVSFLFLYLGAWWANQEGNWGGWWNSDSSEMLGLLLGLLPLVLIHQRLIWYRTDKLNYLTRKIFILFTLFYYFLQINYELSSHNFGLQSFLFFNNNLFFITCVIVFSLLLLNLHTSFYSQLILSRVHLLNSPF